EISQIPGIPPLLRGPPFDKGAAPLVRFCPYGPLVKGGCRRRQAVTGGFHHAARFQSTESLHRLRRSPSLSQGRQLLWSASVLWPPCERGLPAKPGGDSVLQRNFCYSPSASSRRVSRKASSPRVLNLKSIP